MQLLKIRVKGQLEFELYFRKINIILGENNTGKSTLMNLITYALGSKVDNFIDEIKSGLCKQVELDIKSKSGNNYRIIRALPKSEFISILPLTEDLTPLEEEIDIYEIADFSDFLLSEEGFNTTTISYGQNKKASLRLYFLLRAVFVDQNTAASEILSNNGGAGNGFLNSQKLIKKAIIEEILGKDNNQVQKLRLELQRLIKERNELTSQQKLVKEIIERELNENTHLNKDIKKIKKEITKIENEKINLAESHSKSLLKLEELNEKEFQDSLIHLKQENEEKLDTIRKLKLELLDIERVTVQLEKEMEALKKKIIARQFLTQIPVDSCPVCLTELKYEYKEGHCPLCNESVDTYNQDNMLQYKRMLEESLVESRSIKAELEKELKIESGQKKEILEEINEKKEMYLEQIKTIKSPLEELLGSIKTRYEYLIKNEQILKSLLKTLEFENELRQQKRELTKDISEIREDLTEIEKNSSVSDIHKIETWETLFKETLGFIFGDIQQATFDENLLPIVNGNEIKNTSSASLKVATRLAYILSLFCLKDEDDIYINHLDFVLFDSPRDKDLDQDKFRRFLINVNEIKSGQVIMTGSIKEEYIYKDVFKDEQIILDLYKNEKLLRPARSASNTSSS